jgi:hypothetical protein
MCCEGKLKHIKLLLQYNIDVNAQIKPKGATPLCCTLSFAEIYKIEIASLLIEHGAFGIGRNVVLNHDDKPTELMTTEIAKNTSADLSLKHNNPETEVIAQTKKDTAKTDNNNFTESKQNKTEDNDYKKPKKPSFFRRVKKVFCDSSSLPATNLIIEVHQNQQPRKFKFQIIK